MKYYLAGPMTGMPKFNFPVFEDAARRLRRQGLEIWSAHEINHGETEETRGTTKAYSEYLKASLQVLIQCDQMIMLRAWSRSKGTQTEFMVALALNMPVHVWSSQSLQLTRIA